MDGRATKNRRLILLIYAVIVKLSTFLDINCSFLFLTFLLIFFVLFQFYCFFYCFLRIFLLFYCKRRKKDSRKYRCHMLVLAFTCLTSRGPINPHRCPSYGPYRLWRPFRLCWQIRAYSRVPWLLPGFRPVATRRPVAGAGLWQTS